MRHRVAGRKLSRPTGHRLALFRNLTTDLIRYERIRTTEAKAREVQAQAEQVITLGKRGDLHARRQAATKLFDGRLVEKVFSDLAQRYADRQGGYTRIVKLGPRLGDAAPMAVLELVQRQ